jgi:hypothetical protein
MDKVAELYKGGHDDRKSVDHDVREEINIRLEQVPGKDYRYCFD